MNILSCTQSEKNPKIPAINNQQKQINYQQKDNYEGDKFNDNNKIVKRKEKRL